MPQEKCSLESEKLKNQPSNEKTPVSEIEWLAIVFKTPLPAEVCYPVLTFLDPAIMERGLKYLEN